MIAIAPARSANGYPRRMKRASGTNSARNGTVSPPHFPCRRRPDSKNSTAPPSLRLEQLFRQKKLPAAAPHPRRHEKAAEKLSPQYGFTSCDHTLRHTAAVGDPLHELRFPVRRVLPIQSGSRLNQIGLPISRQRRMKLFQSIRREPVVPVEKKQIFPGRVPDSIIPHTGG